jgi:AraC family transcriptional regulator
MHVIALMTTYALNATCHQPYHANRDQPVLMMPAKPGGLTGWTAPTGGTMPPYPRVEITSAKPLQRFGIGWNWWFSENLHISTGSKVEFSFEGTMHLLVLYDEGSRRMGETSIRGLKSSTLRNTARKLTFVPAGCVYGERNEIGASTRMTFLYLDPRAFPQANETPELSARILFDNALVWGTASKLRNAIVHCDANSPGYLELLCGVLAHELSAAERGPILSPSISRGGLASWQKRAVVDYIEEHLNEQFCLPELAERVGLSVHHFCRTFKQSFELPPRRYHQHRRMEVAKSLLADRTTSVTDIALSLGYSHTGSFSNAFRKVTGRAPTTYRREFN